MARSPLKRLLAAVTPVAVLALLLTALSLMSDATQNSERFGEIYSLLLAINVLGLIGLGVLIGWNLVRLVRQVRGGVAGARLNMRMVAMFVLLSVTPVGIVYYFSVGFLHRGIDSWFDVRIEQALDDALELSKASLSGRMRELLKQTEQMASDLAGAPEQVAAARLDESRRLSGASELTLLSAKGLIVASSSADPMSIVPHRPDEAVILQVRQAHSYIGLDPIRDAGLHIQVVVGLPDSSPGREPGIVQALFPVDARIDTLAESVQTAFAKYRELRYLREPLKVSFTLTLSLALLLSMLTAVWAAFFSARRLIAPIRNLVEGTRAVANGRYDTQLAPAGRHELGFLVQSFNDMTRTLAKARDAARQSQQQVEEQRTYLEVVLGRLSSGVLTLDRELCLYTANPAASQILGAGLETHVGRHVDDIATEHPQLGAFIDALKTHLSAGTTDWREEVTVFGGGGRQVLMCQGAELPLADNPLYGHVIVFDDVTALIQAQRNAAWSEVARRLAHEIKNPLTPIQLSAERLRHKYLGKMSPEDGETLDRLTRTIVQQVEAMKGMVNAFSEYARSPRMQPRSVDLNELVGDVLELYRASHPGVRLDLDLAEGLPALEADPDQLRQVLHNLLKNAIEASADSERHRVRVRSRTVSEAGHQHVALDISDSGAGFTEDILEQAFEPYVTTKRKGTGLGLAIVKRIVEEHGGVVRAENAPDGGASVLLSFPIRVAEPRDDPGAPAREAV